MAPAATRTCISWAVSAALGIAGGALANPTGPQVVQGAATFRADGTTLTVVPTAGAIIDWSGFVIEAGETTRFLQPSSSATVLNRIRSAAFGLYGRIESNARVLFIQSGRVFGDGLAVDLPGINIAALRQTRPPGTGIREFDIQSAAAVRSVDPWVVMLVPDTVPDDAGSGALLPSGVSAELADARWPHVRVIISAPPGQALDVAQLLRKSGALGIFGTMLAVPRGQSAGTTEVPIQLARAEAPAVASADELPQAPAHVATADDDTVAPGNPLPERSSGATVAPVMLAAVDSGTVHDVAEVEETAAMTEASGIEEPAPVVGATLTVTSAYQVAESEPQTEAPAEPPAPVIVAGVGRAIESSVRRVPLVASDTPVWPARAPVKLERVVRRMPVIMLGPKGGIFHL